MNWGDRGCIVCAFQALHHLPRCVTSLLSRERKDPLLILLVVHDAISTNLVGPDPLIIPSPSLAWMGYHTLEIG